MREKEREIGRDIVIRVELLQVFKFTCKMSKIMEFTGKHSKAGKR